MPVGTIKNRIQIVGVGLKGPSDLCPERLERIQEADLLVGGGKVLKAFPGLPGERFVIKGNLEGVIRKIRQALKKDAKVVVLGSGDPNFFGIARFLLKAFAPEEMEIHPHVSSVQLAFASIRIDWKDAVFVSVHGRELDAVVHEVRRHPKVAILTDAKNHPARIAKVLLKAEIPDARAFVCSRLGAEDEKIWEGRLTTLPGKRFPSLNVMIVLNGMSGTGGLGIPDHLYAHEKGMITRSEVRAVALSKLRIAPGNVLWDIGAASGSVSVEASWVAQGVTAYAVEKSRRRFAGLKKNIERFGAGKIFPVSGTAPSVLKELPDPDRVFVGGSGGNLTPILKTSLRRLQKGGRIVVNAVTLETLYQTRSLLSKQGCSQDVVSVQIGRGRDLQGKLMLQAETPIFIISAEKGNHG